MSKSTIFRALFLLVLFISGANTLSIRIENISQSQPLLKSSDSLDIATLVKQHVCKSVEELSSEHTEFRIDNVQSDEYGNTYYRLTQLYNGLPVVKSSLIAKMSTSEMQLQTVSGQVQSALPVLSTTKALASPSEIQSSLENRYRHAVVHGDSETVVYHSRQGESHVAYRTKLSYMHAKNGFTFGYAYLSAGDTTKVVGFQTLKYDSLFREVYEYPAQCTPESPIDGLPGNGPRMDEGDSSHKQEESVAQAYDNSGIVYWFYSKELARDSYDDEGSTMVSTVNAVMYNETGSSCGGGNAFWLADPFNQMVYLVDSESIKNLTGALEVVGHEITHAVTDATSNLVYADDSGAINEGISDALGVSARAWYLSGGSKTSPSNIPIDTVLGDNQNNTYWVGASVVPEEEGALRFMNDPSRDGYSVDDYKQVRRCDCSDLPESLTCDDYCAEYMDHGFVHYNSGIFNLMFYLLAEGGSHPSERTDIEVEGITLRPAYRILYYANKFLLTKECTFLDLRRAMVEAAQVLYGSDSNQLKSVKQAFDAVNVTEESEEEKLSTGAIVGIALVGLVILVVPAAVFMYLRRRKQRVAEMNVQLVTGPMSDTV